MLVFQREYHVGGCGKSTGGPPFPSPPPQVSICQGEHDLFGLRFRPLRVVEVPEFNGFVGGGESVSADGRWLAGSTGYQGSVWIQKIDGSGRARRLSRGDET